jgi:hypothetical protein
MCPLYFYSHNAYCCLVKTDPLLRAYEKKYFKNFTSVDTISENSNLQRTPHTVTKWFAPAPLDVASYDTELKMEIKL